MSKYIKALPRSKETGYDIQHTTTKNGKHLVSEISIQDICGYSLYQVIERIVKEDFKFAEDLDEMATKLHEAINLHKDEFENLQKQFVGYENKKQNTRLRLDNFLLAFQDKIIDEIYKTKEKYSY